jgi:hypothetical protein
MPSPAPGPTAAREGLSPGVLFRPTSKPYSPAIVALLRRAGVRVRAVPAKTTFTGRRVGRRASWRAELILLEGCDVDDDESSNYLSQDLRSGQLGKFGDTRSLLRRQSELGPCALMIVEWRGLTRAHQDAALAYCASLGLRVADSDLLLRPALALAKIREEMPRIHARLLASSPSLDLELTQAAKRLRLDTMAVTSAICRQALAGAVDPVLTLAVQLGERAAAAARAFERP